MFQANLSNTVLNLLDELVFAKTDQHLDYLQKTILEATLEGYKYSEVAKESHLSEGHVRDTASELWKILSEVLGEDITKSNIRAVLKKHSFINNNMGRDLVSFNNVHICDHNPSSLKNNHLSEITQDQPYLDLGHTPEITQFYGRITELNNLQTCIVADKYRLVNVLGLKEIGKTTLSLKLVDKIKDNFNYVIRRSLYFCPKLDELLSEILQSINPQLKLSQSLERQLNLFLQLMKSHRCLIILDDLQSLFDSKKLAGNYQKEYQNYQLLFKSIAEVNHQSCLLLLSQEKPIDTTFYGQKNKFIKTLIIEGLGEDAIEILRHHNLLNEDSWEALIKCYQGHPLWLELVASFIQETFLGKVADFLEIKYPIAEETLEQTLLSILQNLTESEKLMLTELANFNQPISIKEMIDQTSLAYTDSLKVIQSLIRRIIVAKDENALLCLNPVFKAYVINHQI
ncbi:MAG: ATPase [Microcystis aeruginosa PMC 728.11]|uniref:ATPase n=1 Tax=Microcystis aeruginosa PCC 9443 TaxID=1160281 RepID=I4G3Z0_MICAE|nr:NB-ARC domain-containing protein [Microcystis aeruginosa]MBE5228560.1 ATPase [Microcystis aeruginosa PMC 728.11]MDY7047328.1 ATPase [Microcystis panniformis WG22]CCI02651.1 ATPase [Microcystis aeruginosa PCC 9443]